MLHGGPFLTLLLGREGLPWPGWLAHLWSGLGLPFFLMLLAVVSLKWSRPTVTFVTCSGGRLTLQRMGRELRGQKNRLRGAVLQCSRATKRATTGKAPAGLSSEFYLRWALPGSTPTGLDTHVTGLKGLLLLSD